MKKRFVHILDREITFEELRVDEKNLKSYVKVLGAFKVAATDLRMT